MTPAAPAVALLFDDVELGVQLREALSERGARIVHEGAVSNLSRELLEKVGADVLVVNLDDVADDALDNLYEAIDGTSRKVVFNDGQASSTLTGWDRARWARHLALKVFEVGEIDPPRPDNALAFSPEHVVAAAVDAPAAEMAGDTTDGFEKLRFESAHEPSAGSTKADSLDGGLDAAMFDTFGADFSLDEPLAPTKKHAATFADSEADAGPADVVTSAVSADDDMDFAESSWSLDTTPEPAAPVAAATEDAFSFDDLPAAFDGADDLHGHTAKEESENLAAELEALLASGEVALEDEPSSGSGLRFSTDDEPPVLSDGHFGLPRSEHDADDVDPFDDEHDSAFGEKSTPSAADKPTASPVVPPVFQLDHLELTPLVDAVATTVRAPPSVSAPSSWSLVDDQAGPISTPVKDSPQDFGIDKMSAAEFLSPAVENDDDDDELLRNFDRMMMEDAAASKTNDGRGSLRFEDANDALGQVVLMGAAASSVDAVCDFLAALPSETSLFFLHTQHLGDTTMETVVSKLAVHSSLPVRLATRGSRAAPGEVLVVPAGQQLRLQRDGSIDLQPGDTHAQKEPSIDASFSMAAGVFMAKALAIVFDGRGNDGVAGSQAVHDRGGKVWVEASSGGHSTDMVSGIVAERLVSFSGTPRQLAARLIEEYP